MNGTALSSKPEAPPDPYAWHSKPPDSGRVACSLCGLAIRHAGLHRAVKPGEDRRATFLIQGVSDAAFVPGKRGRRGHRLLDTTSEGPLDEFFRRCFCPERIPNVKPGTKRNYTRAMRHFERFLGRAARVADLNQGLFDQFVAWQERQRYGRKVRVAIRSSLRSIWKLAAEKGLTPDAPGSLRATDSESSEPRPKPPQRPSINFCDDAPGTHKLAEYFEEGFLPAQWASWKTHTTQDSYRKALRRFEDFLNRRPCLSDLTAPTLDRFERWLKFFGFGVTGGRCAYSRIKSIWRCAYNTGAVAIGPARARVNREPTESFLSSHSAPGNENSLLECARNYAKERGLSERSARLLGYRISGFGKSVGNSPRLSDLSSDKINAWIIALQESNRSPQTVSECLKAVVGLWRWLHEVGVAEDPPSRIRKVKCPQLMPKAWSLDEMKRLLEAAGKVAGVYSVTQINRAHFWRALILVGYHTGLRRQDLIDLAPDDIRPDGTLLIRQAKTGNVVKRSLPPEAMEAVKAIELPTRRRLFGDVQSAGRLRKSFKEIVKHAGLRGTLKKLRATGATHCEARTPGSAMRFLGHKTPGLAYKHYVDQRFIQEEPVAAPTIGGD